MCLLHCLGGAFSSRLGVVLENQICNKIFMNSKPKSKGFTLIELLVVIAIISLLTSVVLASLNSVRDNGRIAAGLTLAQNLYNVFGANADGIWNLDEGSGLIAYKNAGSGPNGTISGAIWTTGPNKNSALSFAGGQSVNVGTATTNVNVTVAAWIKTSSGAQQPIFTNRGSGIYFGTSGGYFFTYYNNSTPQGMFSKKTVNDNKWHHLVWTSNGSKESMYIDGQFDSSMAQIRNTTDSATGLIGHDGANNEYFTGSISQVAVYTESLIQ